MRERFGVHDRIRLADRREGEDARRRVAARQSGPAEGAAHAHPRDEPSGRDRPAHARGVRRVGRVADEIQRHAGHPRSGRDERVNALRGRPVRDAEDATAARRARTGRDAVAAFM